MRVLTLSTLWYPWIDSVADGDCYNHAFYIDMCYAFCFVQDLKCLYPSFRVPSA
jgi:hypothetical protein